MGTTRNYVYTAQSKRFRADSDGDRISDLPESLISHILSCLPTEDAVRTSILSRNWKYKWTCISNIDLSDEGTSSLRGKHRIHRAASFIRFVNRIIMCSGKSRIRRFRLYYTPVYFQYFETWITTLLRRNVQHLDIIAQQIPSIASSECFSGWTSLTELKLWLSCTLNVSTVNCFFNLKSLSLSHTIIKNEQSPNIGHVVMNFPVLEFLELRCCKWLDVNSVVIEAPSLIRFETFDFGNAEPKDCEIKICAPKLDKFETNDGPIKNMVLSAPAVTHATLYQFLIRYELALPTFSILKGFPNLKCLTLSGAVVQALVESRLGFALSTLDRVKELELYYFGYPHINRNSVLELLQVMPSLESLNIDMGTLGHDNEYVGEPQTFINLKEVKFTIWEQKMDELDFVESILKNAKNLEKIYVFSCKGRRKIRRRLSKLITKGSSCILHVEKAE